MSKAHIPAPSHELQPYIRALIERRQHTVIPYGVEEKLLENGYAMRKLGGLQITDKGQMAMMRKA